VRQVVLVAAGELRIEDGPLPEPGPGELRVRAQAVGICGSDLHAFADEHPFIELPVVPGHEAAAAIAATDPLAAKRALALQLGADLAVVEGVPRGPVTIPLHLVQDRELRLQGTAMDVREDVERAIALISAGQLPAQRLVIRSFPLEQAADAFRAAADGIDGQPAVKIQLEPQS
jgi:threonine dehydrogenase-like Zn-dependent dehydrogenase